jgi:hypothetical protein
LVSNYNVLNNNSANSEREFTLSAVSVAVQKEEDSGLELVGSRPYNIPIQEA